MDIANTVLELVKYTLPSVVVLASSYLIVKNFLISETKRKQLALFQDAQNITLNLRLQAYERMALFVERINPRSLITRVYDPSMTVSELQYAITITIRAEFEHNLSQQIYVSKNVWETVKNVKEQEIHMANHIGKSLRPDAPAKELHAMILNYVLNSDTESPTEVALQIIRDEVRTLLTYGAM